MTATTTLVTLRTDVLDILNEDEDTINYPNTLVNRAINEAIMRICSGAVRRYQTGEAQRKGNLPFLITQTMYRVTADTRLSSVVGSTTTIPDTTYYPSSGAIWCKGDIFTYSAKTSTTLTGCTGYSDPHEIGDEISRLYALPANYMNAVKMIYDGAYQVLPKDYRAVYPDQIGMRDMYRTNGYTDMKQNDRFYTLLDGYFLLWNMGNNDDQLLLLYEKKPTTLSLDSDVCIIPDEWARHTVPYLAVAIVKMQRGSEESAMAYSDRVAWNNIGEMYRYYNAQGKEQTSGNRVITGQDYTGLRI